MRKSVSQVSASWRFAARGAARPKLCQAARVEGYRVR